MIEKLDFYDVLGMLIPGVILVCWVPVCFPGIVDALSSADLPEAFAVIALIAVCFFAGQLLQTVGSLIEKALFWSWGGTPSERALQDGLGKRYLPVDSAKRIRIKLQEAVGKEASDRSLFLFAMQMTDSAGMGRASRFNSLYAYHRGLFVMILGMFLLLLVSLKWGAVAGWGCGSKVAGVLAVLVILVLVWQRGKQRAFYYVREVLLTAERVLDERSRAAE